LNCTGTPQVLVVSGPTLTAGGTFATERLKLCVVDCPVMSVTVS
jgi:hypothetical protein